MDNEILEIKINIAIMSVIIASSIAIKKCNADETVYRVTFFLICLSFFYTVSIGAGHATSLYWVFNMPIVFFFIFGKREGLVWNIIFSSCLFFIILTPSLFGWYPYDSTVIPRFIITLFIITIIAYGLESSRDLNKKLLDDKNQALIEEKQELESALTEIKTLSGLIPICSNCKKIRNDEGYWEQVEIYIRDHSEADFTHSICPECVAKLYPDYKDRMKK